MKMTITMTVLAVMAATSTMADTRAICSNVPAASGSVPGFLVPTLGWFVAEGSAEYATIDATVVPAAYDVKDGADVLAFLSSIGHENVALNINSDSEYRQELIAGDLVRVKDSPAAYQTGWCK